MKYLENFKSTLPCGWLKLAINSRKKNVNELKKLEDDLVNIYSSYEEQILKYQVKPTKSQFLQHKDLLQSYYNSAPIELNNVIVSRRNNHGLLYCPYCGYPNKPDTLDHFMPKDDWPEFSILPNNLIPQCRYCAPIKSSKYYCENTNVSKFIHPIYFNIIDKVKFKIDVNFNNEDLSIDFTIKYILNDVVDSFEKSRISDHIKNLDINARIKKFSLEEYHFWKDQLSLKKFDIRQALNQRLSEIEPSSLYRDWKTALYQGMLDNIPLIDYYNSIIPKVSHSPNHNNMNTCDYIMID
jgi:5-methylcytosine-specific restriction endonuclease McrA